MEEIVGKFRVLGFPNSSVEKIEVLGFRVLGLGFQEQFREI